MNENENEGGHPLRGAHYSGSVSGAGDIEFDLSEEGDEVQNLRITQIPCDGGEHDQFPWPLPIAVVDDQFSARLNPLALEVAGEFLAEGRAAGTFLLDLGDCRSPELTWTAAATPTSTSTAGP